MVTIRECDRVKAFEWMDWGCLEIDYETFLIVVLKENKKKKVKIRWKREFEASQRPVDQNLTMLTFWQKFHFIFLVQKKSSL